MHHLEAESLGVPKPQVTRLVQCLEKQLKTLLLHRTTRRVTITADGAAYYDGAVRVLGDIKQLESNLSKAVNARGKLRVKVARVGARLGRSHRPTLLDEEIEGLN